jgi:hypothetical protein
VGLYELLAEVAPDRVLTPLAADPDRGWVVLPDGGPPLAEQPDGDALVEVHAHALVRYGELQASLLPHVDRMLDLGVPDMRPAVMVDRVDEALAVTRAAATTDAQLALHARIEAVRPEVVEWCAHLAASSLPPSLDHNDLHVWNILPSGAGIRFYDWGDSVVAHPFAAMLVALSDLRHRMGVPIDDAAFVRARDAYLDVFAAAAPEEDLVETLDVACRVAKVARALTWERAVRTAREQGESIDEWADAALQTLASVLDESYLAEEH